MHEAVKDEDDTLLDCFNWRLANRVVCTDCAHESETIFNQRELSLPFPAIPSSLELVDLVQEYFKDEFVDYGCEKCGGTKAVKKVRVVSVPRVILFHLNRFGLQKGGRGEYVKRQDYVAIPERLVIGGTETVKEDDEESNKTVKSETDISEGDQMAWAMTESIKQTLELESDMTRAVRESLGEGISPSLQPLDKPSVSAPSPSKKQSNETTPSLITLDCPTKTKYVLKGVVSHVGKGHERGHYVCHVRGGGGGWRLFNDGECREEVDWTGRVGRRGYLVAYVREGE
jgi:ubiquitin C-terminal hydrolase